MDTCTKKFIERNIELIENEQLNVLYYNASVDFIHQRIIPGSIRELTILLQAVLGYEPIENRNLISVPDFYRIKSDITTFIIPDHIERIKVSAFKNCTQLEELTIPRTVVQIYEEAFAGCKKLSKIHYTGTLDEWNRVVIDYNSFPSSGIEVLCTDGETII